MHLIHKAEEHDGKKGLIRRVSAVVLLFVAVRFMIGVWSCKWFGRVGEYTVRTGGSATSTKVCMLLLSK